MNNSSYLSRKTNKSQVRYDFIDNAKGIALLLVISWHCYFSIFPHPVFSEWVLPFFFIVMGCFYKHQSSLSALLVKKANGLLVPWIILSFPAVILASTGVKGFEFERLYNPYLCVLGPCWFLICMFWSYIIFWFLTESVRKIARTNFNFLLFLSCIVVSALSWSMNYISISGHRVIFPLFISAALTCTIFVGIGYCLKKWIVNMSLYSLKNGTIILVSFIICLFVVKILGGGKSFNPQWNDTDQPIIYAIVCAIAGSYIVIQLCRVFPNIFSWIGRNTIPLLCIHYYPTQLLLFYYPAMSSMIRYFIVLMISLPLTYLMSEYFPILNGKGNLIKIRK